MSLLIIRILIYVFSLTFIFSSKSSNINHYVSSTGLNSLPSCTNRKNPCSIKHVWNFVTSNDTIFLLDGVYTGEEYMIRPPETINGESGSPIIIKAENEGKVLINGEGKWIPVMLYHVNYFIVEGLDAHNSTDSVYTIMGGGNNIIRRCTGWDAFDGNCNIFGVHWTHHNVIEDCAGWGIARKVFSSSQHGDYTIFRRNFGSWDGAHATGPKMAYSYVYNNFHMLAENNIGTWTGNKMKEDYILLGYDGKPWIYPTHYTNYEINAIMGMDRIDEVDTHANLTILGNIAYVDPDVIYRDPITDYWNVLKYVWVHNITIKNTVAYLPKKDSFTFPPITVTFGIDRYIENYGENLEAQDMTIIGGERVDIHKLWKLKNIFFSEEISFNKSNNIFNSGKGASVCYMYENGVLTDKKLFPWPMNKRILDSSTKSGHLIIDVTKTINKLFGPIPKECLSDGGNRSFTEEFFIGIAIAGTILIICIGFCVLLIFFTMIFFNMSKKKRKFRKLIANIVKSDIELENPVVSKSEMEDDENSSKCDE